MSSGLTTPQLAERTGVSAGTLRVWQSRYDFPARGSSGGHHRYGEADVRAVEEVVRLRGEGVTMAAAVSRARTTLAEAPRSIYAGLRERRPDLPAHVLSKAALLELTHAIEDEHAASAGAGLLLGSFQEARHYRASEPRWRQLARPVALAVAIADFPAARGGSGAPVLVSAGPGEPLSREWTLIVSSPGAQACLASWEVPASRSLRDGEREFEAVWSFDPATAGDAIEVAAGVLERLAPAVASRLAPWRRSSAAPENRFGAALAARAVSYLGARI